MSTEENKALSRRVIEEIFNKQNPSLADELIDANFIDHGMGFKGMEGFKNYVTTFIIAFPDLHLSIDDMVAEGDEVAMRLTSRGTHEGEFLGIAPTGKQFTASGIVIQRIAGNKLAEGWPVNDVLGMMQQLGVIPPMEQSAG